VLNFLDDNYTVLMVSVKYPGCIPSTLELYYIHELNKKMQGFPWQEVYSVNVPTDSEYSPVVGYFDHGRE
jgi:hypothetical protein